MKTYRYLKEVTNLAAPAYYRGAVRFRWVNAKGKLVKSYELRTPRCIEIPKGQAADANSGLCPPPARAIGAGR